MFIFERFFTLCGNFIQFYRFQPFSDTLLHTAAGLSPCQVADSMPGTVFKFPVMPAA